MQNSYYDENSQSAENVHIREKKGLIPITTHILSKAKIISEEGIEYNGKLLSDISLVGYILKYNEMETTIKVKIWDHTGIVDINFYNKSEGDNSNEFGSCKVNNGTIKVVKIYGNVKVYKKDKVLQGDKILFVDDNELFYHYLEVVNDWLYLTGKLNAPREHSMGNSEFNNNDKKDNNYNRGYKEISNENALDIAQDIISDYVREKGNVIEKGELDQLLQKKLKDGQIRSTIENLINEGYIGENDEEHYRIF